MKNYFRGAIDALAMAGVSRAKVAKECGVSHSLVVKVYRGECGLSSTFARKLVASFNVDARKLAAEVDTFDDLTVVEREALAAAFTLGE